MKTVVIVALCFGMAAIAPAEAGRYRGSVKSFASGSSSGSASTSGGFSGSISGSTSGGSVSISGSSSGGGGVRFRSSQPPYRGGCHAPCTINVP